MISHRNLLDCLVAIYDQQNTPVMPEQIARPLDADPAEVADRLDDLCTYELVKQPPGQAGYRPTVTAYELLELASDDDGLCIIDIPNNDSEDT